MQSPVNLHGVPFGQDPRDGQKRVFDKAFESERKKLNIQLPTGYGKTFTAAGVYAIRQKHYGVNRLLYITPTSAQHEAFCLDGHHDLGLAGVEGPHKIVDISYFELESLRKHRQNSHQVFAVTIQGACASATSQIVRDLLESGRWMICVDEYHHYGVEKTWGKRILGLNYEFLLAMSATPYRPKDDSAFGVPDIVLSYRQAVDEGAIKKLRGHSYIYRIDAITQEGEVETYTTSELTDLAGGTDPEKIERLRIEWKMRWSPKYVSPLVSVPIERMLSERISSGYKLQAIIGAMCVSHAQLVCEQVKVMFPELSVDWVGTGTNGRSKEVNLEIIRSFCPVKEMTPLGLKRGKPTLDILVHVGMAGEGLDTCNVSEITHLNAANLNNSNNQENGRASRYLEGVTGHINYDSSSEYAEYVGDQIMDAMDFLPPKPGEGEPLDSEPRPLPEEPTIQILNMELLDIDSGPELRRFGAALKQLGHTARSVQEMVDDPNQLELKEVIELYRRMRSVEADQFREKAIVENWKESVENALSVVTGRVIKLMTGERTDKSLAGDIKKRINQKKKMLFGAVTKDVSIYQKHYQWLQKLEVSIIKTQELPSWLQ